MQQSIHDFQNLKKEKNISVSNEYLKEILYQFETTNHFILKHYLTITFFQFVKLKMKFR